MCAVSIDRAVIAPGRRTDICTNEVILVPTSKDPDEVDRIAARPEGSGSFRAGVSSTAERRCSPWITRPPPSMSRATDPVDLHQLSSRDE